MIPRFKPQYTLADIAAAFAFYQTKSVERFENHFAKALGQKHAIAFPYGRTALFFILKALKINQSEIICPAYTCVVVPHAIVTSGNEPVFVDSRISDFNMDLSLVPSLISGSTAAIVATSIFGYPIDLDQLQNIRARFPHLAIIQDCAHSFGARWHGELVNQQGHVAFYGLNISKIITSIFGGMITTDQDDLAEKLRHLRDNEASPSSLGKALRRAAYVLATAFAFDPTVYGVINWLERHGALDYFVKYYHDDVIDMPRDYLESMSGVEARVGTSQIRRYEDVLARRKAVALFYFDRLKDLRHLQLPPEVEGATYSHFVPTTVFRREFIDNAIKYGVQLGQLIEYSIPNMSAYSNRSKTIPACPVSATFSGITLNLPLTVTLVQAMHVVETLTRIDKNLG